MCGVLAEGVSANFMLAAVCPSPPLSTELAVLKGSSIHHRLCLADDVCQHPSLRDRHGDGPRTHDAHARTAFGSTGAERPEARLLRRWRRAWKVLRRWSISINRQPAAKDR